MKLERINVVVAPEEKQVLLDYMEVNSFTKQDEALGSLLVKFSSSTNTSSTGD